MIRSVLFDLDGTLADTAPDLAHALNKVREECGLKPLPLNIVRYEVSNGATALTRLGFNIDSDHPDFEKRRLRLLDIYRQNIAVQTSLFEGMHDVLNTLEKSGIVWGIVTNKPARFTEPLVKALNLSHRAACIVSGDTLEKKKPNPEPILHACKIVGCKPQETVYVGDASRDIEAGLRAGTKTLVALFGYISEHQQPQQWGADGFVKTPQDILGWLAGSSSN